MSGSDKDVFPAGVVQDGNYSPSPASRTFLPHGGGSIAGIHHQNTFQVVEKHEILKADDNTGNVKGVCFNVETLPDPLEKHRNLPVLQRKEVMQSYKEQSAKFYNKDAAHMRIEAASFEEAAAAANDSSQKETIVHVGGNGFLFAAVSAFAYHLPLIIAPEHIWMLISYAFAKHVDQNAKALRHKFVSHQGKKRLLVETPPSFAMSEPGNPDSGASAKEWETHVVSQFSKQIKDHIGDKTHATITADFSTTNTASRAASEITLMAAMKNYFSYGMRTCCGIPKITLLGTEQDWVHVRERAEALRPLMTEEFSSKWLPHLMPVLDEFVASYKGRVNHGFWQTMVKLRATHGSGASDYISGWMQILFPYLASGEVNGDLRPWQETYFAGPMPNDFPAIVSSAPVDWDYFEETFDLHIHAGVMGCSQGSDGALMPVTTWFVSHAPDDTTHVRLARVKAELEALLLGHQEEAKAKVIDKMQPWYIRTQALEAEKAELESKIGHSSSSS